MLERLDLNQLLTSNLSFPKMIDFNELIIIYGLAMVNIQATSWKEIC